jgi:hypothetical protein
MPIVTLIYFTANTAYFAVVSGEEMLSSPAVAMVSSHKKLDFIYLTDINASYIAETN